MLFIVVYSLNHILLFATLWTIARQAPLFLGLPRQEYWSGLLFPSLGDLPNPGIKPEFPALGGRFFTTEPPGKPILIVGGPKLIPLEGDSTQSLWPGLDNCGKQFLHCDYLQAVIPCAS